MATGNQTVTTADKHIDTVEVDGVIRSLEFRIEIAKRVDRGWKFVGHGDTYQKTRIPNIATQAKSASSGLNATVYTDTNQTMSINVHDAAAIKHEHIAKVLSMNDVEGEMVKKMGYALARAIDVYLAALFASFSQTVGTLGTELTVGNLMRAIRYLEDAGYEPDSDCTWFISPAQKEALKQVDSFSHADYVGDSTASDVTTRGKLMQTYQNVPIVITNLLNSPASGQHDNALMAREMIALIMAQEPRILRETIALDVADVTVSSQIYGASEIDRYSEAAGNITATDEGAVWLKGV